MLKPSTVSPLTFPAVGRGFRFKKDRFQQVILSISPFGEFTGKIVWMDDEYVGIAFDEDHEKISEIVHGPWRPDWRFLKSSKLPIFESGRTKILVKFTTVRENSDDDRITI